MATRDKHRKRSHTTYQGKIANYNYWLSRRPYILPVGLRKFFKEMDDLNKEAKQNEA